MNAEITITEINAAGVYYQHLNTQIREAVTAGARHIVLRNVAGQRYIGTNLFGTADVSELAKVRIDIYGTPGNDLGAFLDGPTINIYGNVMDASANTMNNGRIVAHGRAGDITGFSSRGGEIFVKGSAGYRVGIHMKEYKEKRPVMVIGGTAQDFLGEYMAGGVVMVLGLNLQPGDEHVCNHVGTGMHGGVIFLRGPIADHRLGEALGTAELNDVDSELISKYVSEYGRLFDIDVSAIAPDQFAKLVPLSARPYKQIYAY